MSIAFPSLTILMTTDLKDDNVDQFHEYRKASNNIQCSTLHARQDELPPPQSNSYDQSTPHRMSKDEKKECKKQESHQPSGNRNVQSKQDHPPITMRREDIFRYRGRPARRHDGQSACEY